MHATVYMIEAKENEPISILSHWKTKFIDFLQALSFFERKDLNLQISQHLMLFIFLVIKKIIFYYLNIIYMYVGDIFFYFKKNK